MRSPQLSSLVLLLPTHWLDLYSQFFVLFFLAGHSLYSINGSTSRSGGITASEGLLALFLFGVHGSILSIPAIGRPIVLATVRISIVSGSWQVTSTGGV